MSGGTPRTRASDDLGDRASDEATRVSRAPARSRAGARFKAGAGWDGQAPRCGSQPPTRLASEATPEAPSMGPFARIPLEPAAVRGPARVLEVAKILAWGVLPRWVRAPLAEHPACPHEDGDQDRQDDPHRHDPAPGAHGDAELVVVAARSAVVWMSMPNPLPSRFPTLGGRRGPRHSDNGWPSAKDTVHDGTAASPHKAVRREQHGDATTPPRCTRIRMPERRRWDFRLWSTDLIPQAPGGGGGI